MSELSVDIDLVIGEGKLGSELAVSFEDNLSSKLSFSYDHSVKFIGDLDLFILVL